MSDMTHARFLSGQHIGSEVMIAGEAHMIVGELRQVCHDGDQVTVSVVITPPEGAGDVEDLTVAGDTMVRID